MEFSWPEAFPFSRGSSQPRDLTQGSSPTLQQDSLPAEPQEKFQNTGVGSLSFLPNPGIKRGSPALQADSLPT